MVFTAQRHVFVPRRGPGLATLTEAPIMPPTILYGNFHNNNIKSIPSNFLVNLPNLQAIDLRNNDIEELNVGAFVDLPQLTTILLDDADTKL